MECALTADSAASARQLAKVLQSLPEGETFVQDDPSLRRLIELAAPARPIRWSSQGAPGEASQATVTLAEALIAQTGSILVTAACGGRGASVMPPVTSFTRRWRNWFPIWPLPWAASRRNENSTATRSRASSAAPAAPPISRRFWCRARMDREGWSSSCRPEPSSCGKF